MSCVFLILVMALVAVLTLIGLGVLVSFLLGAWVFTGRPDPLGARPDLRRLLGWLWALGTEVGVSLWVAALIPFRGSQDRDPRNVSSHPACAVAILPGYLENARTLRWLTVRLRRQLDVPVRAFSPKAYFASLGDLAQEYEEGLKNYLRDTHAESLILVGHSMGGLITRFLGEQPGWAERVIGIVTLGTPHQGSVLAAMAPGKNAREMQVGSRWLWLLDAKGSSRTGPLISMASVFDNIVLPWERSLCSSAHQVVVRDVGHLSLIFSEPVCKKLIGVLNEMLAGDMLAGDTRQGKGEDARMG